MDPSERPRRRGSITGALFLITLGVFFLLINLVPTFDPWTTLFRYWPIVLILLGLGKIWDAYRMRQNPGAGDGGSSGTVVALLVFLGILGFALMAGRHGTGPSVHATEAIELQGAKTVNAEISMPAGELILTGGSSRLLDADFNYRAVEGKPHVDYSVSGDRGQLEVTQNEKHIHFAGRRNDWTLRLGNAIPLDLKIELGAGKSELKLAGMDVTRLEINMGVGRMDLDLTGDRKEDLQVDVQGGVGSAEIRLPKNVGVHVNASGGIGSVNAHGLERDGSAYVNAVYAKTHATIQVNIQGGVGGISLVEE
ncbi:MAG TPA: toast rack family protein [Candidatus Acidoferrales bacterium]|nr:toast rack family protein [Candidatus Acidoferrales bacterium]